MAANWRRIACKVRKNPRSNTEARMQRKYLAVTITFQRTVTTPLTPCLSPGVQSSSSLLPLPADVGEALARYLRNGRPRCSSRRVFIRAHAPLTGITSSATISTLVMCALKKAGVNSAPSGAHVFRHTLATDLLRQGCSLDEIGELLGHRSPNTTAIYAKVDVTALHTLALPWPGGDR